MMTMVRKGVTKLLKNITTIDTLPASSRKASTERRQSDVGIIMNGSVNSWKSLEAIGFLGRRKKKKNFSLVLFLGLSAILCALYYTKSYYPGAGSGNGGGGGTWTLRFTGSQMPHSSNGFDRKKDEKYRKNSSSRSNIQTTRLPPTHFSSSSSSDLRNRKDEITSTVKPDNWRYWASLKYWKTEGNLTYGENEDGVDGNEDNDDELRWKGEDENSLSGKPAVSISSASNTSTPSTTHINSKPKTLLSSPKKVGKSKDHQQARKLLVCNFPRLNPFDPSITDFIKSPPAIDCTKNYPLVWRTNFRNKLIRWQHPFNQKFTVQRPEDQENGEDVMMKRGKESFYSCCYKTISRGNESDHNVIFSKRCFPILKPETEIPQSHEFISVRCRLRKRSQGLLAAHSTISSTNISIINTNSATNVSKIYKDILPFVPLKPKVEYRVRKYFQVSSPQQSSNLNQNERLSIIMLGLDAQSHMNFIRQMPLTYTYLTKNLSSVGLHGYTKVGDNTFPNVVALLSGLSVDQLASSCWPSKDTYFDNCPFIWKNFSQAGYRTSFAEDSVWMGTFNYEKRGFLQPPTDYYLHPLSLLMSKKIGHETWANAKLCYGPRLAFEVLLDYIVKTAVTFGNKVGSYFQFIWANSLFHDYLNNPKLGDELLYGTLRFLKSNGFLNKTAFVLLSDHGIRWGSIRSTYQGKIEERMPMAYFVFPKWWREKHSKQWGNLKRNAGRLTTPFDMHEMLVDLLKMGKGEENKRGISNSTKYGISLFKLISRERTCKMAGIEEHWCVCNRMESLPLNSSLVENGAKFIVKVINELSWRKYKESCAKLKILKINEAKRKIDGEIDTGGKIDYGRNYGGKKTDLEGTTPRTIKNKDIGGKIVQLQIVLVTQPGNAVFEATIYGGLEGNLDGKDYRWKLSGDISRLNLYGEQSACVKDYTVQKYCFCSNLLVD